MSIFNALNTGIYNKMSTGSAGSTALVSALGGTAVYHQHAPDNAALPYVIWNLQAGGPDNITPQDLRTAVVNIRAYASSAAQAGTIDALVSNLFHKGSVTVSGYKNFWSVREEDFELVEYPPDGAKIYSAGGFYRIRLST